ncbi:hypothetical protein SVI_0704 [Shewanella violacea DSS12]|uniref:Uncharacterized protein n=3 Tax=Shewanella violacea TaxID=60217 RepID=D4ZG76_SHEVD|nr:hypothetical protein SVI_0704 [Shewanella violacea DSS12]
MVFFLPRILMMHQLLNFMMSAREGEGDSKRLCYETGKGMKVKYRETSQGGLAIKVMSICA